MIAHVYSHGGGMRVIPQHRSCRLTGRCHWGADLLWGCAMVGLLAKSWSSDPLRGEDVWILLLSMERTLAWLERRLEKPFSSKGQSWKVSGWKMAGQAVWDSSFWNPEETLSMKLWWSKQKSRTCSSPAGPMGGQRGWPFYGQPSESLRWVPWVVRRSELQLFCREVTEERLSMWTVGPSHDGGMWLRERRSGGHGERVPWDGLPPKGCRGSSARPDWRGRPWQSFGWAKKRPASPAWHGKIAKGAGRATSCWGLSQKGWTKREGKEKRKGLKWFWELRSPGEGDPLATGSVRAVVQGAVVVGQVKEKEQVKQDYPKREKNKKYWEKVKERRKEKARPRVQRPIPRPVEWSAWRRSKLGEFPADHLSAAQPGCHLLIQIYKPAGEFKCIYIYIIYIYIYIWIDGCMAIPPKSGCGTSSLFLFGRMCWKTCGW